MNQLRSILTDPFGNSIEVITNEDGVHTIVCRDGRGDKISSSYGNYEEISHDELVNRWRQAVTAV